MYFLSLRALLPIHYPFVLLCFLSLSLWPYDPLSGVPIMGWKQMIATTRFCNTQLCNELLSLHHFKYINSEVKPQNSTTATSAY